MNSLLQMISLSKKCSTFQVDADYFCAGFIVENEVVTKAAPIIKYMIGKKAGYIKEYCDKKKWKLLLISKYEK